MSESPTQPEPNLERLRRELAQAQELVQSVRTELIKSQITVLELQDTILQRETDKADAVSLLGQAELVLEEKINTIFELDRALTAKIEALQQDLRSARSEHERDREARDQIANDLVQKLDAANRALGETHALAGNYARDWAEAKERADKGGVEIATLQDQLKHARSEVAATAKERTEAQRRLTEVESEKTRLEQELGLLRGSLSWRLTKPLRSFSRRVP